MAKKNCTVCGAEVDKLYPLRCPTINNKDRTVDICYDCHQAISKYINQFIDNGGKA